MCVCVCEREREREREYSNQPRTQIGVPGTDKTVAYVKRVSLARSLSSFLRFVLRWSGPVTTEHLTERGRRARATSRTGTVFFSSPPCAVTAKSQLRCGFCSLRASRRRRKSTSSELRKSEKARVRCCGFFLCVCVCVFGGCYSNYFLPTSPPSCFLPVYWILKTTTTLTISCPFGRILARDVSFSGGI